MRARPSTPRSPKDGCPGSASRTCRGSRSRRAMASRSSTRPGRRSSRRCRSRAGRTAWRWSPASTIPGCTRRRGARTIRATRSSRSVATRPRTGPVDQGRHPLPGPATRIVYDDATQMVHLLGQVPGSTGADGDPWTVYVVEPHGNAVYADARLPADFTPAAWAADIAPDYPSADRQELLVFSGSGSSASIEIGSHAFAWRLPGVIAGALDRRAPVPAGPDPVPSPARGRAHGALRAGRRDVLRPVADRDERRLRRAVHRRGVHPVRGDLDRLVARPAGLLAGHAR